MLGRVIGVVAITAVSGLAGEFTLVYDDREIVAQGSSEGFDGFDFSSDDLLPDFPFEDWSTGAGGFGATSSGSGSGSSFQDSSMA
ncbi:MAG: hypothetical protein K8E66_11005, partial [Phycisphaerales bacterium]|nr:hypothetical protein [Phycisphaerales bacterium]